MAARSHSRFTDEIYCTPAPTNPQIDVRKKEELAGDIFVTASGKEFAEGLLGAEELDSKELFDKYPPQFKDKNKRRILELLNRNGQYSPPPNKPLLVTRWKPFVPYIESNATKPPTVQYENNLFTYQPDNDDSTVEWYLNFANGDIFAYYAGHLLAQDELQVLECVELASLREYFVQTVNTVGSRTTGSDAHNGKSVPTPILISNVERAMNLDTTGIYGNAFARAEETAIDAAFEKITPQVVNLIAIEAPSYGQGQYTEEQIRYILTTCYTGFKAAQILANKTQALNQINPRSNSQRSSNTAANSFRTKIHTGWWGCGAYGNNRQLMLIAQTLAAQWAQIDEIVFHVQNDAHQKDIDAAQATLQDFAAAKDVEQVVQKLLQRNFEWEKSNNT